MTRTVLTLATGLSTALVFIACSSETTTPAPVADSGTPTGSTDAATTPTEDSATPIQVGCGSASCTSPQIACCSLAPPTISGSCIAPGDSCAGQKMTCNDGADCASGEVCCGALGSGNIECKSAASCGADGMGKFELCGAKSECPSERPNCCSAPGGLFTCVATSGPDCKP